MRVAAGVLSLLLVVCLAVSLPGQESRPGSRPRVPNPAGVPNPATTPTAKPAFKPAVPPLPEGVLARINGRNISAAEYMQFLYKQIDTTQFAEFVDDFLIQEQATRLAVQVPEAQVQEQVDQRVERTVQNLYQGDASKFEAALGQRYQTLEGFRRWSCQRLRTDMLLELCILAERQVTEADVQRHFARVYGDGGVQHQIRHILLLPGSTHESVEAQATRLLQTLSEDPGRFVELVHKHSQDPLTRRTDGFIANYRSGMFGQEFQELVNGLTTAEEIAGPVKSTRGVHIVQLIQRVETPFDGVADEIRTFLREQPPTALERARYREELRRAARVER